MRENSEESATPRRRRGRPQGSTTEQGLVTRERIIQAAAELFAEKGFHGTAVGDIGERVNIQRGALYYHIRSKEELLWEVLHTYTEMVFEGAQRIVETDLDPVDKLRLLVRHQVQIIAAHQSAVAIQQRDADALTGDRAAELQTLRDRVQAVWQRVLDEGYRAGRFRTADHVITNGLLGMVNYVYLWYRPGLGDTPEAIAEKFSTLLTEGMLVRPEADAPPGG
jgi:AcrR family transcriptional regulator